MRGIIRGVSGVVVGVFRYPVKGLGGESLPSAQVRPGAGIAFDRRWLLATSDGENDGKIFSPDHWRPWNYSVTLKTAAAAAHLRASIKEKAEGCCVLTVASAGGDSHSAEMDAEGNGGEKLQKWLREFLRLPQLRLLQCPTPGWDERELPLTVINAASVNDFAKRAGVAVSPARFRGNIVLEGATPWSENAAKEITIGKSRLRALGEIPRCPATQVNPQTAERDLDVPKLLRKHCGKANMGIYADAIAQCEITKGAAVNL